ncbi:MAG: hypothetical protein ACHQKY_14720 [Terriglobia bacterium]
MKLEQLSLRQVTVGILLLSFLNWAFLQFVALPGMEDEQRRRLYSGWASTPYPYAISAAFIVFAIWFVFYYRGQLATRGLKIAVFGMALGALCGMVIMLVIRTTWHI